MVQSGRGSQLWGGEGGFPVGGAVGGGGGCCGQAQAFRYGHFGPAQQLSLDRAEAEKSNLPD